MATYYHNDTPGVLPDVETFRAVTLCCDHCGTYTIQNASVPGFAHCPKCGKLGPTTDALWFYWYRTPGYSPDSDPIGPFDNEDEALADAFTPCED